jgi:hypothetical protein
MRKLAKWEKKLTKAERTHLREMEITSLRKFKETILHQNKSRSRKPDRFEPCWECLSIASKLGLKDLVKFEGDSDDE